MPTNIKCNKCGNEIEITEAIREELEVKILQETQTQHQAELSKLKQVHELTLKQKETDFEKYKLEMSAQARKEALEKIQEEYRLKEEQTKRENQEREHKIKELQETLVVTMKELRSAKDTESKLKIEFEQKLLDEQSKIKQDAKKEAEDALNLKILEKDKMLADAQHQIKEMERKIQQGSQQLQGEVQELQLEEILRREFQFDEITEVPKGINGADVLQVVRTRGGAKCGTIVWESKNTKNWSPGWVAKLIEDQRTLKAEVAVLVSSVLPKEIKTFGQLDKIWVTNMDTVLELGNVLRQMLVNVYAVQQANQGKEDKANIVYEYLTGNGFKQRIEVLVEYFHEKRLQLDKERMYFTKKWDKEEKEVQKVINNTVGIYGDLQGLIGNALPKINSLELPETIEEDDDPTV